MSRNAAVSQEQTNHLVEMMDFVCVVDPHINNILRSTDWTTSQGTDCDQHKHNDILQLRHMCQANIHEIRSPSLKPPKGAAVDGCVPVLREAAEGESGRQEHSHWC